MTPVIWQRMVKLIGMAGEALLSAGRVGTTRSRVRLPLPLSALCAEFFGILMSIGHPWKVSRQASASREAFFQQLVRALALATLLLPCIPTQATAAGDPQYMKLPPIVFSLHGRNHKIERQVAIVLTLELKPSVSPISMRPYVRLLQDRLLQTLQQLWEKSPTRHVSVQEIKQEAMPAVVAAAGPDKVEHVLVLDLHERTK